MNLLAIYFDDTPPEWKLMQLCSYVPAATVLLSWALIRWKRSLVVIGLVVATVAAYWLLTRFYRHAEYLAALGHPYPSFVICAFWFSGLFPFTMIGLFYFTSKKEPIQPSQPTRSAHG